MGQQQLLLLVLSTVIVGLATVAGIQAFSENQAQANQDALTRRGVSIVSDIKGAVEKPTQLGGIDTTSASASDAANAIGLDSTVVSVDGAGGNAECGIQSDVTQVVCVSDDSPQDVQVDLQGDDLATSYGDFSI